MVEWDKEVSRFEQRLWFHVFGWVLAIADDDEEIGHEQACNHPKFNVFRFKRDGAMHDLTFNIQVTRRVDEG